MNTTQQTKPQLHTVDTTHNRVLVDREMTKREIETAMDKDYRVVTMADPVVCAWDANVVWRPIVKIK